MRPIQTGMRGVTASGKDGGLQSIGLSTNLKIADRPVTKDGLGGVGNKSLGPERKIYDRNFVMNDLREKMRAITSEIERFKVESERL